MWITMFGCAICIIIATLCKETGITAIVSVCKFYNLILYINVLNIYYLHFQGICAVYDIVMVNKIYPVDVINFCLMFRCSNNNLVNLVQYKHTILRLSVLFIIALILLFLRFSIMGFSVPKFQPVDNPTSFMDSIFLRILNYNYIYSLNAWLLICPVWLCFDWSMGCIPLITDYDRRIFMIIIFWLIFLALITYIFISSKDKTLR